MIATHAGSLCSSGATDAGDLDTEFIRSIVSAEPNRRQAALFLANLERLDAKVQRGLLKTWLHVAVVTGTSRRAHFLRAQREGTPPRPRPMDAIVAPFGGCNLACRGCYYQGKLPGGNASPGQLAHILEQLRSLDVYHVLLAGQGEPFFNAESRAALFAAVRKFPQLFFTVYSNGTTITDADLVQLQKCPNLLPMISLDGPEAVNDWRRGRGVYQTVRTTMQRMRDKGLLFGYITTVFRQNMDAAVCPEFIAHMAGAGCQIGYYSLFVGSPKAADRAMLLTPAARAGYFARLQQLGSEAPIPLVDIDGIEARFGCRARRGATVYINAITGKVSPCIRIPETARNAPRNCLHRNARLDQILGSDDFLSWRESLPETGPCAAFNDLEPGA
jgi:MoaA/NifB/PqqE/SkfB family radical SAM enzyme